LNNGDWTVPRQQTRSAVRIQARIAPDALATVKRAAEIQGRSVSNFIAAAATEAANRIIEQTQIIQLSPEDQRLFAEAIINPPPPNEALRRAGRHYRKLIKGSR
jgi:uncharacterized protein (DUF1778 family)